MLCVGEEGVGGGGKERSGISSSWCDKENSGVC